MAREPERMDLRSEKQRLHDRIEQLWQTDPEAAAELYMQRDQQQRLIGCLIIFGIGLLLVALVVGYWATH